jgi:hypothetical protein
MMEIASFLEPRRSFTQQTTIMLKQLTIAGNDNDEYDFKDQQPSDIIKLLPSYLEGGLSRTEQPNKQMKTRFQ